MPSAGPVQGRACVLLQQLSGTKPVHQNRGMARTQPSPQVPHVSPLQIRQRVTQQFLTAFFQKSAVPRTPMLGTRAYTRRTGTVATSTRGVGIGKDPTPWKMNSASPSAYRTSLVLHYSYVV